MAAPLTPRVQALETGISEIKAMLKGMTTTAPSAKKATPKGTEGASDARVYDAGAHLVILQVYALESQKTGNTGIGGKLQDPVSGEKFQFQAWRIRK